MLGIKTVHSIDNKNYEIGADMNNVLKLINYFFNLKATSCQELSKALSDSKRTLTFKFKNDITQNPKNNDLDVVMISSTGSIPFTLTVLPDHGYIERPTQQSNNNYYGQSACGGYTLILNDYSKTQQQLNHAMIPFTDMRYSPSIEALPSSLMQLSIFSSCKLKDPNERLLLAKRCLKYYHECPDKQQEELLKITTNLIKSLPHDQHFTKELLISLLDNGLQTKKEFNGIIDTLNTVHLIKIACPSSFSTNKKIKDFIYTALSKRPIDVENLYDSLLGDVTDLAMIFLEQYNAPNQTACEQDKIRTIVHQCMLKKINGPSAGSFFEYICRIIIQHNLADKDPLFPQILQAFECEKNVIHGDTNIHAKNRVNHTAIHSNN